MPFLSSRGLFWPAASRGWLDSMLHEYMNLTLSSALVLLFVIGNPGHSEALFLLAKELLPLAPPHCRFLARTFCHFGSIRILQCVESRLPSLVHGYPERMVDLRGFARSRELQGSIKEESATTEI